jgi:hypothetical protein
MCGRRRVQAPVPRAPPPGPPARNPARTASIQALRSDRLAYYYRPRRLTLYVFVIGQPLRPDASAGGGLPM